jgi:glucose-6-phosphate 1-dehydrogenase
MGECVAAPNVLVLTLQPDEGFALCVDIKRPGEPFQIQTLPFHFLYEEAFGPLPDGYQTLLLDVLTGDQTLFVHADEAEPYAAGTWGPDEAVELPARDGHTWHGPVDVREFHERATHPHSR